MTSGWRRSFTGRPPLRWREPTRWSGCFGLEGALAGALQVYEIMQVYGMPVKGVTQEEFSDGN